MSSQEKNGVGGDVFQQEKELEMSATIRAEIMEEGFSLYDHLVRLARTCGLRDGDFVIYRYADAQGSNYQGESLVQWCDGWQDQYHGEPDELVEWIEGFQKWVTKNQESFAAIESLSANLLDEDDAPSVPNKGSDEVPLEQLSSVPKGVTLRTVQEVLNFLDEFDGCGMVATDEYLQVEGIRKWYGHLLKGDYEDEEATPQLTERREQMGEKRFDLLRDVPCQVNYLCGDGWQPHTLVGEMDYIVSNLAIGDTETTFSLHDEKGVIGCYRVATADFQQQFNEKP